MNIRKKKKRIKMKIKEEAKRYNENRRNEKRILKTKE